MASVTINNLNDVDSSFSKDNYLIIGQGQIGKKTTIQGLFDLTKDSSSRGASINYISYTLDQSSLLTDAEKAQARSNLGINEAGTIIESGVSSVNGQTGDANIYLNSLKVSSSDTTLAPKYISDSISNAIYGNTSEHTYAHNLDPDAHAEAIEAAVNTAITDLDIGRSISEAITTHNEADGAHAEAFAKFTSDTLSEYSTKEYLSTTLNNALKEYTKTSDLNIPSKLSDLTDGLNTIYTIKGISGSAPLTPTGSDRSVTLTASFIGAVPISRTINGQSLADNVTITAANIGAVPTSRKINGQPLTNDVTITASSISALSLSSEGASTIKGSVTINKSLSVKGDINLISSDSNKMYLSPSMYGNALPASGSTGQIFFVLESS